MALRPLTDAPHTRAVLPLDRSLTPAWFTRIVLIALGLAVLFTISALPTVQSTAPRENNLSVLGLLLPESVWQSSTVMAVALVTFLLGMVMWAFSSRAVVGAVLAVVGLTVLGSFRVETELYARHQLFQPFAVLAVLAAGTVLRRGKLDVPAWIWTAVAVVVGWGYTLAGFEKLLTSGVSWADGTSLRVWLTAFAEDHALAMWIARTHWVAVVGQVTVLVAEVTAVAGLGFRKTRLPAALVLLSFHVVLDWWLGLAFYPNEVALLALAATPFISRWSPGGDAPVAGAAAAS